MPFTSRRALLASFAAVTGFAGCTSRDGSGPTTESDTVQETPPQTSERTEESRSQTGSDGQPLEAPRPSSIASVDADWPAVAFDAANTAYSPNTVGPVDDPRLQWVGAVPASGAPPVVADGLVIALGYRGSVTAVDATDGSVEWAVDLSGRPGGPVVADSTFYVLTRGHTRPNELVALDLTTGEREWTTGSFEEVFGGLTVTDDAVYAAVDEGVVAVDPETGEQQWWTPFPDAPSTHGPVTVVDDRVVIPDVGTSVVALDTATGEREWTVGSSTVGQDPWRVLAAHGRLYVSTSRSHTDPYDTPTVHALDLDGEHVGSYATEGSNWPGLAATSEGLVVVDRVSHPPDQPPETPVKTVEATPARTPPSTSTRAGKPTRVDGLSADLSTREWRVEAGTSSWRGSPPAVAGDHVYFGSREGTAVAVDVARGQRAWTHTFEIPLDLTGPAVVDGVCVFGSSEGLVALAAG